MATETAFLENRLKAFVAPDTTSDSPGFVQAGSYEVLDRKLNFPNNETDYAQLRDAALGEVWVCSRWTSQVYVTFEEQAGEDAENQLNQSELTDLILDYDGFSYSFQDPAYPYEMPGISIPLSPPNPAQNNCCTFVEGIVVKAWADQFPNFTWNMAKHNQMMITSTDDYYSPVTAVLESGMATPVTDNNAVPPPWTLIQGWNSNFTGGHTFLLVAHHAPTDAMLTLESNKAFGLNGVGFRGIGMAKDFGNRPPENWWNYQNIQTWEDLKNRYPNRRMANLRVKNDPSWAWLS